MPGSRYDSPPTLDFHQQARPVFCQNLMSAERAPSLPVEFRTPHSIIYGQELYQNELESGAQQPSVSTPTCSPSPSDNAREHMELTNLTNNQFAREGTLCEILSCFHSHLLPETLEQQLGSTESQTSVLKNRYTSGILCAIKCIFRAAMEDDILFHSLRRGFPTRVCAMFYFKKQYAKAKKKLKDFPLPDQWAPDVSIPQFGEELRRIVQEMMDYKKNEREELGDTNLCRLAEMLVDLIREVCNRDYEINHGLHAQPRHEHDKKWNLYAYLISDPSPDADTPNRMQQSFIIDQLNALPEKYWKHLLSELESIRYWMIKNNEVGGRPAASVFAAKIEQMKRDFAATFPEGVPSFAV